MGIFIEIFKVFLYELDFFKEPFQFRLQENRSKISTKLGSAISLTISLILAVFFFQSDMFSKRNPAVLSQTLRTNEHPRISLNSSNFQLSFQIFDKQFNSYAINPQIFNVYLKEIQLIYSENGTENLQISEKSFSLCGNSSNFTYCLDDSFEIQGYPYSFRNTSFLIIDISLCNRQNPDKNCANSEEMAAFFLNKGFMLSFTDYAIDYEDLETPIFPSKTVENMWLDTKTSKYLNIYLKKTLFFDDSNAFFEEPVVSETFSKDFSVLDYTNSVQVDESLASLAQIMVFSSENVQKNRRNYQKIGQVLGNLSGIYNFLFVCCVGLVSLQNSLKIAGILLETVHEVAKKSEKCAENRENEEKTRENKRKIEIFEAKRAENQEFQGKSGFFLNTFEI